MGWKYLILFDVFWTSITLCKVTRLYVKDAVQRDVVEFVSDAPLEKAIGLSHSIAGWIEADLDDLKRAFSGEFEVDLRTFDTGNVTRNEHLRDKFFHASEHPLAVFSFTKLLSVSKPRLTEQQPIVAKVEGMFTIKGVARAQPVLLRLQYFPESEATKQRLRGNLLRISSSFDLDLVSFNIPIPETLKLRLTRFVQVHVDVTATDSSAPAIVPLTERLKPLAR